MEPIKQNINESSSGCALKDIALRYNRIQSPQSGLYYVKVSL